MGNLFTARKKRALAFCFDLAAIGLAFAGAFLLRFDFHIPKIHFDLMIATLPWVYAIQAAVFVQQGLYRGVWSFASMRDLLVITRAVAISVLLSVAYVAMAGMLAQGWPRSVFIIDAFLLVVLLGGARFAYRFARENVLGSRKRKRILIIGAGQTGNLLARELLSRPDIRAKVVGFLDDNSRLKGLRYQGVQVLGEIRTLQQWAQKLRADEIIIAIPSLTGSKVKQVFHAAKELKIPCRICPPIRDVMLGKVDLGKLREIRVEDLLRREVVATDDQQLHAFITGRTIMVTGAGGSIGSELCRQILLYSPKRLVLFERSEFNLYRIEQELRKKYPPGAESPELEFIIGDVLNEQRLQEIFGKFKPEAVLHAAAYKHVPIMEENVVEAIRNNVAGTHLLARTAAEAGVETFVLISTDKAVRPTSVMGATKRMAELVTQAVGQRSEMRTMAVRFGNVLDSEGSVLPLFRDQIARGGPVTVTHPEVTRYFMTIPEAALLVIQAAGMGKGGELFLLDMGEPVLIRELAEDLITLAGLRPHQDIKIVYTGLRKGEKLYEELLSDLSHAEKTPHPKIVVSEREMGTPLPTNWEDELDQITHAVHPPSQPELLKTIASWVPEYKSPNHQALGSDLRESTPVHVH